MMRQVRDIILYGDLPKPVYVLRIPVRGTPWRTLMQATRRLVKYLSATPQHKAAPDWYVDGDAPAWETTKCPRYFYNANTGEFERAK